MLEFHTLDVFTDQPFAGNPLAVVLGADALTTVQMQTIAAEFNLSETIFVLSPINPAHTARVRIFLPNTEIPFAGHPTIGCAIHLACAAHQGDFSVLITLEEEAGLVPVRVHRKGDQVEAEFAAPVLPFACQSSAPEALVKQALGLDALGFRAHRTGVFEGGPRFLFVPVPDLAALRRARPLEPAWSEMLALCDVDKVYVYTAGEACDFQARMFAPTAGIAEDPATGSASAILAAQLLASGEIHQGSQAFTLHQGVEMGRPSTIRLSIDANPSLAQVRIGGSAVPISRGQMAIPCCPLGNAALGA